MNKENNDVYSKAVRAGKRTYFFDIKATRGNELYLTITESRKSNTDGVESFQKHKIFLYKEDFNKFSEGLHEILEKIDEMNASGGFVASDENVSSLKSIGFEDL